MLQALCAQRLQDAAQDAIMAAAGLGQLSHSWIFKQNLKRGAGESDKKRLRSGNKHQEVQHSGDEGGGLGGQGQPGLHSKSEAGPGHRMKGLSAQAGLSHTPGPT